MVWRFDMTGIALLAGVSAVLALSWLFGSRIIEDSPYNPPWWGTLLIGLGGLALVAGVVVGSGFIWGTFIAKGG
jgi:hypothetical protein